MLSYQSTNKLRNTLWKININTSDYIICFHVLCLNVSLVFTNLIKHLLSHSFFHLFLVSVVTVQFAFKKFSNVTQN